QGQPGRTDEEQRGGDRQPVPRQRVRAQHARGQDSAQGACAVHGEDETCRARVDGEAAPEGGEQRSVERLDGADEGEGQGAAGGDEPFGRDQYIGRASAWRRRRESVASRLSVSSGAARSSVEKSRRLMTSRRSGVSATTVAERGPPSRRLISPKYSPGCSRPRLRGVTSTRALPSRIRKNSSPGSPRRASTVPAGTSRTSLIRAIARSCLREQPASRFTS